MFAIRWCSVHWRHLLFAFLTPFDEPVSVRHAKCAVRSSGAGEMVPAAIVNRLPRAHRRQFQQTFGVTGIEDGAPDGKFAAGRSARQRANSSLGGAISAVNKAWFGTAASAWRASR